MRRVYTSEKNRPFKRGIVKEIDPARARVRVEFADEDGNVSFWLNVNQPAAAGNKAYWMPDVGAQVNCLMDWDGEDGCVLGALYSEADAPPTTDGDAIHIRTSAGMEIIISKGGGTLTVRNAQEVLIQAAKIVLDGEVHLGGDGGQLVHRKGDVDSDGDAAVGSASKVYAV
jgi:phage baseplate assembly protein V